MNLKQVFSLSGSSISLDKEKFSYFSASKHNKELKQLLLNIVNIKNKDPDYLRKINFYKNKYQINKNIEPNSNYKHDLCFNSLMEHQKKTQSLSVETLNRVSKSIQKNVNKNTNFLKKIPSKSKTMLDKNKVFITQPDTYALKTGLHVGHKSTRLASLNFWHPLMAQFFLGSRHGISLLDPIQTRKCLLRAFYVIALVLNFNNLTKNTTPPSINGVGVFSIEKTLPPFNVFSIEKTTNRANPPLIGKPNNKSKTIIFSQKNPRENSQFLIEKNSQLYDFRKGHILIVNTNPEFSQLYKNLSVLTGDDSRDPVDFLRNLSKWNTFQIDSTTTTNNKKNTLNIQPDSFQNISSECISYVYYKWVGGTLTNWKQVSKSVLTYAKFAARCDKFISRHPLDFPRYKKIKECFQGLIKKKQGRVYLAFREKPDIVFLMNPNENRHIIAEANNKHIPVVALVESNTCLKGISYPIPANIYSAFFIYYCVKKILSLAKNK